MAGFRIIENERQCTLCRAGIAKTGRDLSDLWVFSEQQGPVAATNYALERNFGEAGYLVHKHCIFTAIVMLKNGRLRPALRWLHEENRYLWSVPRTMHDWYTTRLAADAFHDCVDDLSRYDWDLSDMFTHIKLLPPELQIRIGKYSYPSAVVAISILFRNIRAMDCRRRPVHRREKILSGERSICCHMRGKYVAEVNEVEQKPTQPLLVCYDDFGCMSATYESKVHTRNASWYQFFARKRQKELIVSYKVCCYLQPRDLAKLRRDTALNISPVANSTENFIY